MSTWIAPFVDIQVEWARLHQWEAGAKTRPQSPAPTPLGHKLWLTLEGEVNIVAAGERWAFPAGTAGVIAMQHSPGGAYTSAATQWLSVGFYAVLFRRLDLLSNLQRPILWQPEKDEFEKLKSFMNLLAEYSEGSTIEDAGARPKVLSPGLTSEGSASADAHAFVREGLGRALLGLCWPHLEAGGLVEKTQRHVPNWLHAAFEHIHSHPQTSVSNWSNAAGFSPAQFRRLFHEWVGCSPQEYLNQSRIADAKRLLETTSWPAGVVAEYLGFQSLSHFTRLFKKATGTTPKQFQKRQQLPKL